MLLVGVGGFLGATARYLITEVAKRWLGATLPWGTLAVNGIGSFLVGYLLTLGVEASPISVEFRLLVITGLLGGLTTFSALSYETIALFRQGAVWLGATNLALNLLAGLAAVWLGMVTARAA